MPNLFERNIVALADRLVVLAPSKTSDFGVFRNVEDHSERHQHFVHALQRMRGGIYLNDGAVQQDQLLPDGRHQVPEDDSSWHFIMLNPQGQLSACAWYHEFENTVSTDELRVRDCPLARSRASRDTFWTAVEGQLARARREGLRVAEVGGWAVAEGSRHTANGLILALGLFSLGRLRGECLGFTTATVRHCSSSILRTLGYKPLEAQGQPVPTYFDPRYGCDMEMLQFDSRRPNARYAGLIEQLREKLANVLVTTMSDFSDTFLEHDTTPMPAMEMA